MRLTRKRVTAAVLAATLAGAGTAMGAALPALADGANGEVRGYLWPGTNGTPNWEGTYRMPDGVEAWCASIWEPEPIFADGYGQPVPLTKEDGTPLSAAEMQTLAYVVSTASDVVINQVGKNADDHAAAASVIIHDITNAVPGDYDPSWPLGFFDANADPNGTGQQTEAVHGIYDQMLADAGLYGGEWVIDFDPAPSGLQVGDAVEITGALRTINGTPIPARVVDASRFEGLDVPATTVTTDANGRFSIPGTITNTSAELEVSLSAPADTVMMREPTTWSSASRPQNMVLVDNTPISDTISLAAEVPLVPVLGTSATDQADGDKVLPAAGGTVVDVVSYENLTPGVEYTVRGELMDKATGEGTGITGETTFTPATANGTVEVLFTVPAGHAGSTLVVFERLYDAEGTLVATHEDIDSTEQTVTVTEVPPVTPGTPIAPGGHTGLASTGGAAPILLIGSSVILLALGGLLAARRRTRI
jgi:hypothetical protein